MTQHTEITHESLQQAWVRACVASPATKDLIKTHTRNELQFQSSSRAHYDQLAALLRYGQQTTGSWSQSELYWLQILEQARCDSLATAEFKGIAINICAALEQCPRRSAQYRLYLLCKHYFWPKSACRDSAVHDTAGLPLMTPGVLECAAGHLQSAVEFELCVSDLVTELAQTCCPEEAAEQSAENPASEPAAGKSISNRENPADSTDDDAEEAVETESGEAVSLSQHEASSFQTGSRKNDTREKYTLFSTQDDEIVSAADIATSQDHQAFKRLRSAEHSGHRKVVRKIAHRLQRQLMIANQRSWLFEQEQGVIDPARLSRLITQTQFTRIFRHESPSPIPNTAVSLLVDQSGSMQGERSRMAVLSLDVIVSVLESCAIKCEVLGYTTRYWAENPLAAAWRRHPGKNPPGRLNATRHIIYKKADTPWRHVAHHCGIMLRSDFGRENIDGEALLWASQRLQRRHEPNKILLVLSDGSPMDEATLSANSKDLLVNHLRHVIRGIETQGKIQLAAIGIAHKVGHYYSRAVEIDEERAIGDALEAKLAEMIIHKPSKRMRAPTHATGVI